MKISLIAAVAKNNAIGRNNELMWHLPADFKHFKEKTSGHFILMGRKTFESFPKPLPNRIHLVITRQLGYSLPDNCLGFASITEALEYAKNQKQEIVYVIGGGEIYTQTMALAHELLITHVDAEFTNADAFFPEIGSDWTISDEVFHKADDRNNLDFKITTYKR